MNKYIYLMIGLLVISTKTFSASCAGGAGIIVTGVDEKNYCRSSIAMNWWSAFAWCEGANMTLISLEDCNGMNGNIIGDVACPNFKGKGTGVVWTSSVRSSEKAYRIDLSNGTVEDGASSGVSRAYIGGSALCK